MHTCHEKTEGTTVKKKTTKDPKKPSKEIFERGFKPEEMEQQNLEDPKIKNYQRKRKEEYEIQIFSKLIDKKHNYILREKGTSDKQLAIDSPLSVKYTLPYGKNILSGYEKVQIKDLKLGQINKNKYMCLKIASRISIVKALMLLGEDDNGDIVVLHIYGAQKYFQNYDWNYLENTCYPEGRYILLVDPFYKVFDNEIDGIMAQANDISVFKITEEVRQFTWMGCNSKEKCREDMKGCGNWMMFKKQFDKAAFYYDIAINFMESNIKQFLKFEDKEYLANLHSNISESYLKYGYYSKALKHSEIAANKFIFTKKFVFLKEEDKTDGKKDYTLKISKALNRKLRALVELRRYKEAYDMIHFVNVNADVKEELEALLELEQLTPIKEKIEKYYQNSEGKYDYLEMLKNEEKKFYLENGDFFNPKIIIEHEKERGLKLVAKEQIKKGELLIAEKALVALDPKTLRIKEINRHFYESSKQLSKIEFIELYNSLTYKLIHQPYDYEAYFSLCNIKNLNETLEQRKEVFTKLEKKNFENPFEEDLLTDEKIEGVVRSNSRTTIRDVGEKIIVAKGIWPKASFFNHCCNPNCTYTGIGDFIICHSLKDLEPGEELTISYLTLENNFECRSHEIKRAFGFDCKCNLCKLESEKMISNIGNEISLSSINSTKIEFEKQLKELVHRDLPKCILCYNSFKKVMDAFEQFLKEKEKLLTPYEVAKGYLNLSSKCAEMNPIEDIQKYTEIISKNSKEAGFYSLELRGYNILLRYALSLLSDDEESMDKAIETKTEKKEEKKEENNDDIELPDELKGLNMVDNYENIKKNTLNEIANLIIDRSTFSYDVILEMLQRNIALQKMNFKMEKDLKGEK